MARRPTLGTNSFFLNFPEINWQLMMGEQYYVDILILML